MTGERGVRRWHHRRAGRQRRHQSAQLETRRHLCPASENLGSRIVDQDTGEASFGDIGADAQVNVECGVGMTHANAAPVAGSLTNYFRLQSFHMGDYAFYFLNLRENVAKRIEAYRRDERTQNDFMVGHRPDCYWPAQWRSGLFSELFKSNKSSSAGSRILRVRFRDSRLTTAPNFENTASNAWLSSPQ